MVIWLNENSIPTTSSEKIDWESFRGYSLRKAGMQFARALVVYDAVCRTHGFLVAVHSTRLRGPQLSCCLRMIDNKLIWFCIRLNHDRKPLLSRAFFFLLSGWRVGCGKGKFPSGPTIFGARNINFIWKGRGPHHFNPRPVLFSPRPRVFFLGSWLLLWLLQVFWGI